MRSKQAPRQVALGLLIYAAALVDALAIPGVFIYWATTWPKGGIFTPVLIAVMAYWGIKRAHRALTDLPNYRWFFKWVLLLLVLSGLFNGAKWLLS